MDIPPYHICQTLSSENDILNAKYRKLTRKYKEMRREMLDLQEKLTRLQIEKECITLSSAVLQKQPPLPKKEPELKKDKNLSLEKMLTMHNDLLKKYERETKVNSNQGKKLRRLEADNEKLKDDIFETNQQMEHLKRQLSDKDQQLLLMSANARKNSTPKQGNKNLIDKLKAERNTLEYENQKLREELKGLDKSFFDEIEDMKYALQQSAKLNVEYEKALRKLCKQFGVNYQTAFPMSKNGTKRTRQLNKSRRKSKEESSR